MTAMLLYRIVSVLLLLFAIGNTFVFRRTEPGWGVDSVVDGMRNTRFEIQGLSRSFWDFYTGYGLFATAFLLFAAVLAWQLGGLSADQLRGLPAATWGLAVCLVGVAILSWRYFLVSTGAFASLVALLLVLAAIRAAWPSKT
jgi:hypothetical protein